MSLNLLLHFVIILIFIPLGIQVYNRYKNTSWIFFLIFSILISIWLFLYTLVFSVSLGSDILLYLNRFMYFLSLIWIYNMLLFVLFFNNKNNINNKYKIFIPILILWFFSILTPYILESMSFSLDKGRYIENYWIMYPIFSFLYMIFLPLFSIISYFKLKSLHSLNKIRLLYVIIGFFIFVFWGILFLTILPLYWIHVLDDNIPLLILPFLCFTWIAIHSYSFININLIISKIVSFIVAWTLSIISTIIIKNYYIQIDIWWINKHYNIIDIILAISIFYLIHTLLNKKIFFNKNSIEFAQSLNYIKKQISYLHNLHDVNKQLKISFKSLFWINQAHITYFSNTIENPIFNFFEFNKKNNFFINEKIFLQKNKNNVNSQDLSSFISSKDYIIFPINLNNKLIGYFSIWKKRLKDHFYNDEIKILEEFQYFLETHLKYINSYKKIHELSVNLDKKVDEQTIGYNQLINKQKEFISYVSHEVKGPIASSIFQIDSILEEVIDDELNKKDLLKELHILNELLLKTGELVNKLFSIQQFELTSKSLFKERVHLINLLKNEIWLFQKVHTNITFITNFDESISYFTLDKVQFRQVIDNLINNSIKIINQDKYEDGQIFLGCTQRWKEIIIEIEDNWVGFTNLDIKKIFDKYTTWKWSSVWLGMGLYLCKTIVELHWGNIQAAFWKKLWWAKIIIKIPII